MHAAETSADGKHHTQNFTHTDTEGKTIRLEYTVEHLEDGEVFSLDHSSDVQKAKCPTNESLEITFSSPAAASAAVAGKFGPGSLVCGASHHDCGGRVVYRRIVAVTSVVNATVILSVEAASLQHFFKEAHVKFYTSKFEVRWGCRR